VPAFKLVPVKVIEKELGVVISLEGVLAVTVGVFAVAPVYMQVPQVAVCAERP
jgi:hypothetical protein